MGLHHANRCYDVIMPSRALVRRGTRSVARLGRWGGVAKATGRVIASAYRAYRRHGNKRKRTSALPRETGTNYGSTFQYTRGYSKKKTSRKAARRGVAKRNRFLYQMASLQNPLQSISSPSVVSMSSTDGVQVWYSFDFLKGLDVRNLMASQVSIPGQTAPVLQDLRLYLKSFLMKYHITNVGNGPAQIEFFWLQPRMDIADSEIPNSGGTGDDFVKWFLNYAKDANSLMQSAPSAGLGTSGSAYSSDTLDASLFMFPFVTRLFKIMRTKVLTLPVGGTFTDTNRLSTSKFLDFKDWATLHYKRGVSSTIVWRIRGYPTATTAAQAVSLQVSLSESQSSKVINIKPSNQVVMGGGND